MDELTILSPLGCLGYGIPEPSLRRAFDGYDVDVIAVDAGSIDPGPNYLGEGKAHTDEHLVERDLGLLIDAVEEHDLPLLVGTSGGCGAAVHLDSVAHILGRIVEGRGREFDVAKIYTDVDRDLLERAVEEGTARPLDHDRELTLEDVRAAERAVAQVGPEPFIDAYEDGADVILGGRSSDLAPFATVPLIEGFDEGITFHLSKILECGTHTTVGGEGSDCLIGVLREDEFEVEPTNPEKRCTPESVAAHTLYEKADPHTIHLPHGEVDVSEASFEAVSDRRVRVSGSRFEPSETTSILVEGVELAGYRTITPAGTRDFAVIENLDSIADGVERQVAERSDVPEERYELTFRMYGRDGVLLSGGGGDGEDPPEVGVVIDAVAETQDEARTICGLARSTMLHYPFEGRVTTAGNLAFPYSPSDIDVGEVYEFSIYHLLDGVGSRDAASIEREVMP